MLFALGMYGDMRMHIVYASIGVALSSMMNLFFAFFRGAGAMKYEAVVLVIQKVLFIALALVLMISSTNALYVLLSFMLSMLGGLVLIFIIFKRNEKSYLAKDRKDAILFKQYIKDVLTLALVEIFATVYFRLNQVFIEHYRGLDEVSIYGVAYRIIEVFTNIPAILLLALFPSFARLAEDNIAEFKIQFDKILKYLFGLGIISALVCWFSGEYVFKILGSDYSRSYIVLRYLCFPLLFIFPNYLVTQALIALNRNLLFARILFSALLFNIVLSFILVPQMGAAGSAVSIGICEVLIFVSGFFYVRKNTSAAG
jgi:O-antigen/teichoic acid export membrane protein